MMYKEPSRRWVALKAAYLLPLSALALVAFARPQAMKEIEERMEEASPAITQAIKAVAQQIPSLQGEGAEATPSATEGITDPTPDLSPTGAGNGSTELPDSNLVRADLRESETVVLGGSPVKPPLELLDSTMLAVGARRIADGTYFGHFQPSLASDTVRIAMLTIRDRQSQITAEHRFAQNADAPDAYNITLNAETRKDRKGYYIRYLQPVNSSLRNYDKKEVDPKMLSTDSVLTKRSSNNMLSQIFKPVAIEKSKKETRIYMYTGYGGMPPVEELKQTNRNLYMGWAIVDELTGDKYCCRSTDYDYFKHIKDEYVGKDTINVCQICLVFPPIDKRVKEAHLGSVVNDNHFSQTFNLNEIPRKGRIITN